MKIEEKRMRYELRKWTDGNHTDYVVMKASNDKKALEAFLDRPSMPNEEWYRSFIVDTHADN
jgi:hypothetical protein